MTKGLAVVTGASSGIGYQLARLAAEDGHDLALVADEPQLHEAAEKLRRLGPRGTTVEALEADLATREGLDTFWAQLEGRPIALFFANAGRALGRAFHDQSLTDIERLIALNMKQTTFLLHRVGRAMRAAGSGRILVVGSIGGDVPGPFDAVYDASKAYINSLAHAMRNELKETGVVVTCLMPGPVDTPIFERNDMGDTPIGQSDRKADPERVAHVGYEALMEGEADVIPGTSAKVINALEGFVPNALLAEFHRRGAEPGRG